MRILSIETSCDETAMALIEAKGNFNPSTSSGPKFRILENLVASQIKIHQPFGGVVPNLAKREHEKNLPILINKIFNISTSDVDNIDLIAVTVGPGLEPCLWTGVNFAKDLTKKLKTKNSKLKLIGVNHLEGHLYSFLLKNKIKNYKNLFPAIALIVSGGHTILLLMKNLTVWKKLGETRDDAAGEAFDKVARLLNLPYPGGPNLEKIAHYGSSTSIVFPRPMIHQKNYDFSFSGLKTAVLYYLRDPNLRTHPNVPNVAASFQQAVIDVLLTKTFRAAQEFKAKSIFLSGGVANNKSLRQNFRKEAQKKTCLPAGRKLNFFAPLLQFTTDNAAMTAAAAYFEYFKKPCLPAGRRKLRLVAQPNLNL